MRCLTLLTLAAAQPAQQPAPAAETTTTFTAAEAYAFALCQDASRALAAPHGAVEALQALQVSKVPGYAFRVCAPRGDATLAFVDAWGPGDHSMVYAFPLQVDDTVRRAFCVRCDGLAVFTDNTAQLAWQGSTLPVPDAALERGGDGSLQSFLRTPGKGGDGNMWLPFDTVQQVGLRVRVVDEQGQPHARVVVETRPAAEGATGLMTALPAGRVRTSLEGDGLLRGAPARGLVFAVVDATGAALPVGANDVAISGWTARVTVPRAALTQVRANRPRVPAPERGLARANANESAAIATLKNISSAQAQCQACGIIDGNNNGAGEYGTFAELAGVVGVRGTGAKMSPPVLSSAFGKVTEGLVQRSGYCFKIFLPGKDSAPLPERATGGTDPAVDPARAETQWCAYAWPIAAGESGQRAFFVDQNGDVFAAPNAKGRYSGAANPPAPGAARQAGKGEKLDAPAAVNVAGQDGERWDVIN